MPGSFIAFLIIFAVAVILTTGWIFARSGEVNKEDVRILGGLSVLVGLVAGLMLLFSSIAIVPANEVGIVTTFGRWSGTTDSGMHVTAPWSKVDTFPTRNQKSIRDAADGNYNCVPVKLNGGASACVDATILYTIDDTHAETLWRGWGSFAKLNEDLINRSTDDAFGVIYGGYTAEAATSGTNREMLTTGITTLLTGRLSSSGVRLESVTLGDIHLPKDVQDRINNILEADSKVIIAQKQKEQAAAEAEAAKARQVSLTREALIKECLDAAREIKPQVFDCGLGGQSSPPVIVGGK